MEMMRIAASDASRRLAAKENASRHPTRRAVMPNANPRGAPFRSNFSYFSERLFNPSIYRWPHQNVCSDMARVPHGRMGRDAEASSFLTVRKHSRSAGSPSWRSFARRQDRR
jgi:hypothetical protein